MSERAGVLRALLLWLVIGVAGLVGSISAAAPKDAGGVAAISSMVVGVTRFRGRREPGDVLDGGAYGSVLIVRSRRPGLGARLPPRAHSSQSACSRRFRRAVTRPQNA